MKAIEFICYADVMLESPVLAKNNLPEWWKETSPYITKKHDFFVGENGRIQSKQTIKRCVPVFDVISAGYLIVTSSDLYIRQEEDEPYFLWENFTKINWQSQNQSEKHPQLKNKNRNTPKIQHFWGIKTPKGYSMLFMPPAHRDNIINILPGLVDTDKYHFPVELPFTLSDPKFEGMIPAGTPIAQLIPIKRESWKSSKRKIDTEERNNAFYQFRRFFVGAYRNLYWVKKDYQ